MTIKQWTSRVIIGIIILFGAVIICGYLLRDSAEVEVVEEETIADASKFSAEMERDQIYGIYLDSLDIEQGVVKRRQNITKILSNLGLQYSEAISAANAINEVYDIRFIKAGNRYMSFFSADSLKRLKHFVYIVSASEYVRCDIDGRNAKAELCKQDIIIKERLKEVEIQSSLWNAVKDANMPYEIALQLSEIYAWTVDFFGIEKGDKFRILYTEEFVDDTTSIGVRDIKGAIFESKGVSSYAFLFDNDSTQSYFDLQGNSLRKAFLKAPLRYSRISSRFSGSRMHPILKKRRAHYGVDYAAPSGTPVQSIGDGTVIEKGFDKKGGGNYVKVRHNSVYTSVYMHLRGFAKGLKRGARINQGELIGYVGKTGLATGPHLDFRVYMNGKPIDPLKMEAPSVEPVSNDNFDRYIQYSDSLKTILERL
ncbi:MAG: peptidoglycan DD-metalloendopeptidase family protein [Bacteroidia bacterium]|nr:peptidoglycan DD-metalloendopeptidase family protein [Bacteroidia bacterium]